jgi:uracil-DNA glycosylase family 4
MAHEDQDDWRRLPSAAFDSNCTLCARLAAHLAHLRAEYPDYYNAPVAPFGAAAPRLLIVGLAPGAHGANATGRPFTGDYAGLLLYRSLHKFGLSSEPESRARGDGLRLRNCRITNAVKCLPPANKPTTAEVDTCNRYLATELAVLPRGAAVLALGAIAHRAVLRALGLKVGAYPFAHGRVHALPNAAPTLVDSYHCSRYNTQTGRLTAAMFEAAVAAAKAIALR